MKQFLLKLMMVLATLGLFAGIASADTFQAPSGSEVTWQDDGKGNAIVTWTGMQLDTVEHYLGEGQGWGRVVKIKPVSNQVVLPNIAKNGLRFNGLLSGRWIYLPCGAQEGHYPGAMPRLGNGLRIACNYVGGVTEDGRPIYWGAIEHPQFMRRAGDGKGE